MRGVEIGVEHWGDRSVDFELCRAALSFGIPLMNHSQRLPPIAIRLVAEQGAFRVVGPARAKELWRGGECGGAALLVLYHCTICRVSGFRRIDVLIRQ
jgi:hypothetical protein